MLGSVTSHGMVEKQLKPRGISDPSVIAAMQNVPRHLFCEQALARKAYSDCSLPIGKKQTMSAPFTVAFMLQKLMLKPHHRILDVGTGSGYQAAVLSRICKSVYSVEKLFTLAARAKRIFDDLGYYNISVKTGNGYYGWKEYAPYDAIIVAAVAPKVPKHLIEQLTTGGRLIIPLAEESGRQKLYILRKEESQIIIKELADCTFVKFVNY